MDLLQKVHLGRLRVVWTISIRRNQCFVTRSLRLKRLATAIARAMSTIREAGPSMDQDEDFNFRPFLYRRFLRAASGLGPNAKPISIMSGLDRLR